MTQPTPGELEQLRGDMAALVFTESVQVERITRPTDQTTGQYTETKTIVWTGLVDRKPATESRQNTLGQATGQLVTALSYWDFSFPVDAQIMTGDRILSSSGRIYDVLGVLDKSTQIATYVFAQERSSGASS